MSNEEKESPRKRQRLDDAGTAVSTSSTTQSTQLSQNQAFKDRAVALATRSDLKRELRSGITAFVNTKTQGFQAIFKQRYSDFLVNEILPSGEVLHLVDVEDGRHKKAKQAAAVAHTDAVPASEANGHGAAKPEKPAGEGEVAAAKHANGSAAPVEIEPVSDEDQSTLREIFGEECTQEIIKLYHKVLMHPDRKRKDFDRVVSAEMDDKDVRTKGHMTIRRVFKSRLDTTTQENSAIAVLAAMSSSVKSKNQEWRARRQAGANYSDGRLGWDEVGGQYLHFTLYKENKDTMEVMSFLASQMKLHPRNFTFAGTKDRRGVTVQRVSAYRVQAGRLAGLGGQLRNAKIGGFKYEQSPLSLGELDGNEFVIVLRDAVFEGDSSLDLAGRIALANEVVQAGVSSLKINGFINYYGLQRFGTFSTSTDQIGIKLLQDDFKGAIDLILAYDPEVLQAANGERPDLSIPSDDRKRAVALETWKASKNLQQVLPSLPRKFTGESNIIKHLGYVKHGKKMQENDFQGAINQLQRPLRLMYVHAYQSLVWNTVAGYRWENYGDKVIEGDLVVIESSQGHAQKVDEAGEIIVEPKQEDRAVVEDDYVRARPLSKEEAESGKYTISDVVLPLPGFDVVYPANDVGKYYEEFMSSERGGGLDPHSMRRKTKDFSLSGGYRKLLAKPALLDYEIKTYSSDTESLAQTDLDRLDYASADTATQQVTADTSVGDAAEKKLAVVLKLQLGSSQYASMALRELLKAGGLGVYKPDFQKT